MARQARWVMADVAHLVELRAHARVSLFVDDIDRQACLDALREAAAQERVAVHAFALRDAAVRLLATPPDAASLGRMVQGLGRRYVAGYNRRHGHRGTLFDGRFRAAAVAPDRSVIDAMRRIEQPDAVPDDGDAMPVGPFDSRAHHAGLARLVWLSEVAPYWNLGNTPFDREHVYGQLLAEPLAAAEVQRLDAAVRRGWPIGPAGWVAECARQSGRDASRRPRGRPPRAA